MNTEEQQTPRRRAPGAAKDVFKRPAKKPCKIVAKRRTSLDPVALYLDILQADSPQRPDSSRSGQSEDDFPFLLVPPWLSSNGGPDCVMYDSDQSKRKVHLKPRHSQRRHHKIVITRPLNFNVSPHTSGKVHHASQENLQFPFLSSIAQKAPMRVVTVADLCPQTLPSSGGGRMKLKMRITTPALILRAASRDDPHCFAADGRNDDMPRVISPPVSPPRSLQSAMHLSSPPRLRQEHSADFDLEDLSSVQKLLLPLLK